MRSTWLKKTLVGVSCLSLVGGIFGGYSMVSALETSSIFNQEQIEKDLEEARSQVVVADKGQEDKKSSVFMKKSAARTTYASTNMGTYPTRRGVILVTTDAYKNLIPTGHAAIVANEDEVIESLSDGVQYGDNDWASSKDECFGVTCGSTSVAQDASTVTYIVVHDYIGKPYNFNYLDVDTRERFYCSQLVWAAYKDMLGIDLNTSEYGRAIHPTELINTDRTVTIYRHRK